MVSILIIDTWGNLPFLALVLLGGLQSLPGEPYEAARVDGATATAIQRYLTLRLLVPFIILAVMFRAMDSLRIFDVIYATTLGGPADATMNLHMQQRTVVAIEVTPSRLRSRRSGTRGQTKFQCKNIAQEGTRRRIGVRQLLKLAGAGGGS